MADFPDNIKAIVTQGYSFSSSLNAIPDSLTGANFSQALDFKYAPVNLNVGLVLTPAELQQFQDFYYNEINTSASKFNMNLDTGMGVEPHVVYLLGDTLSFDGGKNPTTIVNFEVLAERTTAQDAPFGGGLSDLYDEYGDGLDDLLDALAIFVLEVLPE